MTIRPIRELGDPVLRTPADEVRSFDRDLAALVRDLEETVDHPGRAGLAAPQIGVGLRVFSYDVDDRTGVVVNPTITALSEEEQEDDEGCLSVPRLWYPTRRALRATVAGTDEHGEPVVVEGEGLLARCLQHEVDHLDGRLYLDRLDRPVRREALRAVREAAWAR